MKDVSSPLKMLLPLEAGVAAWRRACEAMTQGFAEIAAREVEFCQVVLLDGAAELEQLSRVRNADEYIRAGFSLSGEHYERVGLAWRNLIEAVQNSTLNAFTLASAELKAPEAKAPRAAKPANA